MKSVIIRCFFSIFLIVIAVASFVSCGPKCAHEYIYNTMVDPTCRSSGYTEYICLLCGGTNKEYIPPLEHEYALHATIASNCTAEGYEEYACIACGDSYRESLPMPDHSYTVTETMSATCAAEGYIQYNCTGCADSYRDYVSKLPHTPGAEATIDAAQTCVACGTVLRDKLFYMDYLGNELEINYYYGFGEDFQTTSVDSRYHGSYTQNSLSYVDQNGNLHTLEINLPLQEFYSHDLLSVSSVYTADGKRYITNSGFGISFAFRPINKRIDELYAWSQGDRCLRDEFSYLDDDEVLDAVKIVASYPLSANSAYYNRIYEVIDFSSSYIEVAKKTDHGYVTIKKIESLEDWNVFFQSSRITADNGQPFIENGTYRILFKYDVLWVTNPSSAVYDEDGKAFYPYGRINSQYESFYVTIENANTGILLPNDMYDVDQEFYYQLRALTGKETESFIPSNSTLIFNGNLSFALKVKVGKSETGYYFDQKLLQRFDFELSVYNEFTNQYDLYRTASLMDMLSEASVVGEELMLTLKKDEILRGQQCKISIVYTMDGVTEQQDYYSTIYW